ncbi:MAG: beta-ketoacyl-ACP synthase III [Bacteroidetes bacterium]|nr:beta-ketoacyl-ACP synthase III [Bacteroidota bacterium]HET6244613.1 beta-ketoacyl-ACP synthase III [Bacteroidia bacterium]
MNKSVYINRISKFLPGNPVSNDEMEQYLGFVGGDFKSRSKPIILRNNKITNRYYALDKQGKSTYSNAQLSYEAIKGLVTNDFKLDDIQLLTCGTTTPDQLLPSHASMVHGQLKSKPIEAISFAGSCCAGMNALKYAYMSVLTGYTTNAVTTGSEKLSQWMVANNFSEEASKLKQVEERPILAFEKEFLRWMLSDGAAAVLISDKPNSDELSLKIEWIEIVSFANEVETCMYAGGEKTEDGEIKGWATFEQKEWLPKSLFSLRQDTRLLETHIAQLGTRKYIELFKKHNVDPQSIDWLLPHISSEFFRSKVDDEMKKFGVQLPQEKWFINLTRVGNIGAAAIFVTLAELMSSGKLKKGQKIVLTVPESARFSYANALLTVC